MKLLYLTSIILLIISSLILKKNNKKNNIINSIIYFICFLFSYQTLIVYISGLFNLGDSLLYYSLINILVSLLLIIPTNYYFGIYYVMNIVMIGKPLQK